MSIIYLNREDHRRRTFDENWPHAFISINLLAKSGFYYIGPLDQVKCYFCGLEVNNWEMGDNEIFEHKRWSPNCPLLSQRNTSNVPIDSTLTLNRFLPLVEYNGINGNIQRQLQNNTPMIPLANTNRVIPVTHNSNTERIQVLERPKFPDYAIESSRLRTFDEWPRAMKQRPRELIDAGFFYTHKSDRVICFSCGGILRDWCENDIPWEQHALWYDTCSYLQLTKGQEYIDEIKKKFTNVDINVDLLQSQNSTSTTITTNLIDINSAVSSTSNISKSQTKKTDETNLCKICYSNEYSTVFFPCAHIVCCTKCASSITKCPICQKTLERIMRVFFA